MWLRQIRNRPYLLIRLCHKYASYIRPNPAYWLAINYILNISPSWQIWNPEFFKSGFGSGPIALHKSSGIKYSIIGLGNLKLIVALKCDYRLTTLVMLEKGGQQRAETIFFFKLKKNNKLFLLGPRNFRVQGGVMNTILYNESYVILWRKNETERRVNARSFVATHLLHYCSKFSSHHACHLWFFNTSEGQLSCSFAHGRLGEKYIYTRRPAA